MYTVLGFLRELSAEISVQNLHLGTAKIWVESKNLNALFIHWSYGV